MSRIGRRRSFVIAEYELGKCDIGGNMGKNMTSVMDGMYAYQVRQWTMTKMDAYERCVAAGAVQSGSGQTRGRKDAG